MTTVAKKLAAIKPGTLLAGVDLGLDRLVVVVLDTEGRRVDRFKTEHSRDGYTYLSNRLRRLVQPPAAGAVWIGMEPTNYYWKLLATRLRRRPTGPALSPGQPVDGQPPALTGSTGTAKAISWIELRMTPARTAGAGWRDAFVTPHLPVGAGVADLLRTGKFTETQLRVGAYAQWQLGHATYWRLRLDRGRQLTRLTNSLRQVFPELSQVFKDLTGVTAQAVTLAPNASAGSAAAQPPPRSARSVGPISWPAYERQQVANAWRSAGCTGCTRWPPPRHLRLQLLQLQVQVSA
jgi:hypothetical protein